MTEITLRVHPLLEVINVAVCLFPSLANAIETTIAIIQPGIRVTRSE